jgi:hypothetical protein
MGSMTLEVNSWNAGARLRAEFAEPAAQEPADADRLKVILAEIARIKERVAMGDTTIYSEVLGCWIKVLP